MFRYLCVYVLVEWLVVSSRKSNRESLLAGILPVGNNSQKHFSILPPAEKLACPAHFTDALQQQCEILVSVFEIQAVGIYHQYRCRVVMIKEIAVSLCHPQQISIGNNLLIGFCTAAHTLHQRFRRSLQID